MESRCIEQRNVYITTFVLVPGGRDKRTRAIAAAPVGRSGSFVVPAVLGPDEHRCIQQVLNFTGKSDPNMMAVDDGSDMIFWGVNDLKNVESRQSFVPTKVKVRGKMKAVA